jgi:hypothetical protein
MMNGRRELTGAGRIRGGCAVAGLVAIGLTALCPCPALAWRDEAHRLVTAKAIETLPKDLKAFYKKHRLEMPTLALEPPEPVPEGPERRFSADRLMPFPFDDLPRKEADLKARFPEKAAEVGRLPWLILESYDRLVAAFRANDKAAILQESDSLASLVTDLHNPLALTENSDGQKTGQHGLWIRIGEKLPQILANRLGVSADAARYLDSPTEYIFATIPSTYVWVDNLLYEESLAHRGMAGYGEAYYDDLRERVTPLVKRLWEESARDVGSFWYTAWTVAGRPPLQ